MTISVMRRLPAVLPVIVFDEIPNQPYAIGSFGDMNEDGSVQFKGVPSAAVNPGIELNVLPIDDFVSTFIEEALLKSELCLLNWKAIPAGTEIDGVEVAADRVAALYIALLEVHEEWVYLKRDYWGGSTIRGLRGGGEEVRLKLFGCDSTENFLDVTDGKKGACFYVTGWKRKFNIYVDRVFPSYEAALSETS